MINRKPKLFHPGAPELLRPNMRAKLKQQKESPAEEWRQNWTPLEPSKPRQVRAGSMDFLAIPSVIGGRK